MYCTVTVNMVQRLTFYAKYKREVKTKRTGFH